MSGARRRHNIVAANAISELRAALRDAPCEVYSSDMRVRTADGTAAYPDASVACGAPRFTDETEDELLNPVLVVEVLSESTEAYDRGEKFEHYRTIASLRQYLLVDPRRVHVDVFCREEDGWKLRSYGRGEALLLDAIGATLKVDELYLKVF